MVVIEWLNANSGAVTAIATVALAIFTAWYVWLTKHQANIAKTMLGLQISSRLRIERADNTAAVINLSRETVTVLNISINSRDAGFHPEAERRTLEPGERRIIASSTDIMEDLGKQDSWEVEVIYFYAPAGQARGAHDTVTFGRTKD